MIIIDIKSGSKNPCTELQLAGYSLLVKEGIDEQGNKFIERQNKTAFEITLFHPIYFYGGTIDIVYDDGKSTITCYALYLNEDSTYKLDDHTEKLRHNQQVFLSFLTVNNWKKEKGVLNGKNNIRSN